MADGEGARGVGPVVYNVDGILDAHTHLTGEESADQILECMDFCESRRPSSSPRC
jgi:hypothetical protein